MESHARKMQVSRRGKTRNRNSIKTVYSQATFSATNVGQVLTFEQINYVAMDIKSNIASTSATMLIGMGEISNQAVTGQHYSYPLVHYQIFH